MNFRLTVLAEISESRLCLDSDVHHMYRVAPYLWVSSVTLEIQGLIPPGKGDEEYARGFAKTFPDIPCANSKYLATDYCGLAILLDHDKMEITLVDGTWNGPLRTDSASFKFLESFIQFTTFCNS